MKKMFHPFPALAGSAAILILLGLFFFSASQTEQVQADTFRAPVPQAEKPDNAICLGCHQNAAQTMQLPNGEFLPISVDPTAFENSVHAGIACVDCHPTINTYPHPEITGDDRRALTLQYKDTCRTCHPEIDQQQSDSIHRAALEGGNRDAAVCSDCHNPHTQAAVELDKMTAAARVHIAQTCARCHSAIYDDYAASVHGAAVLLNNNPDVPACTDCHGVHQIGNPTSARFRLSSIKVCANCHTNKDTMDKYGISTAVLNTYVADFHGTTVTLFEHQNPDEQTNKPVCYDCHGFHTIKPTDDPQHGIELKQNLLVTCQKCHPDASENFPASWLSHYEPSPEKYPLVYYVRLFYLILIPAVIGGMLIFVVSDFIRRRLDRQKEAHETWEVKK
jgi:hypothetical protein